MVGHLRRVEDALRLRQLLSHKRLHERSVLLADAGEDGRTLGIDVVAEVLRVHTGVSGELALVKTLYYLKRCLSAV